MDSFSVFLVPHKPFLFLKIYVHGGFRMMSEILLGRKTRRFQAILLVSFCKLLGKYSNVFHTQLFLLYKNNNRCKTALLRLLLSHVNSGFDFMTNMCSAFTTILGEKNEDCHLDQMTLRVSIQLPTVWLIFLTNHLDT